MSYNGWTNYATWRVNLELFDGMEPREFGRNLDKFDLADLLKDYAEEAVSIGANELARDYALAFLSDVDWQDIAKSMLDAYQDEEEEEEEEAA